MQTLQNGYRGLGLILELNWDRILVLLAIATALGVNAYLNGF